MLSGKLYNPYKLNHVKKWRESRNLVEKFNNTPWDIKLSRMNILKKVFARIGEDSYIEPPFYCDYGWNISIGDRFYANTGLIVLDGAMVTIGDNVFIAPRVSIYTAGHPIDSEVRNLGLEYAKSVNIGNNVWIGGNTVINPGVNIGNDVVIGSGSVVTKDIPNGVVAAGNPCHIIRYITNDDKIYWEAQAKDYFDDIDT